jgi:hypothetical protein
VAAHRPLGLLESRVRAGLRHHRGRERRCSGQNERTGNDASASLADCGVSAAMWFSHFILLALTGGYADPAIAGESRCTQSFVSFVFFVYERRAAILRSPPGRTTDVVRYMRSCATKSA